MTKWVNQMNVLVWFRFNPYKRLIVKEVGKLIKFKVRITLELGKLKQSKRDHQVVLIEGLTNV